MKIKLKLEAVEEKNPTVFAINTNYKAYRLCWHLNKAMNFNFVKSKEHNVSTKQWFVRYKNTKKNQYQYDLIVNRSKKGYFIPTQKSINFFLIINNSLPKKEEQDVLDKIKNIPEVQIAFKTEETKYKHRFFINDKEN